MKKFLITIILSICSLNIFAQQQIQWFQATSFASKIQPNGYWSDWESSNVKMYINFSTDEIVIFSPTKQYYRVIAVMNPPYDSSGTQMKFKVIDKNGYYGYVRLRIEHSGNSQLYVDFADLSIVYNVIKIE